ncbi:MAG TPA: vWA domain-containing protein [Chloroflexota bacterium]|nr:vWA domain-containing protein [Chloroflexota bacterium]
MSRLSKIKFISFIFLVLLTGAIVPQTAAQEDSLPLDIILLLDSSGSTASERELIQKAAEFLLDYLEANTDLTGLDYRLSVVGFNQGVIEGSAIPLGRPTDANLAKFFTDTRAVGDTDFKPALNHALNEFIRLKTLETGRLPIVILMTDGQPARQGEPLPDAELNGYFGELGQTITTAVNDTGVQLFVVAVGDAAADQARWQNILPTKEQYVYINDSSNLSEVYWQFLSEFMGGEQDAITSLTADTAQIISVEPYLDELTFTVLKDTPGTEVVIEDPNGNLYTQPPAKGGDETDLHEIHIIPTPGEGDWQLTLQGSDGRLLVNRRYPQVSLGTENPAVAINTPFLVRATVDSESLRDVNDLSLLLVDNVENYEEATVKLPFEPVIEGLLYEVIVPGLADPDTYELSPLIFVGDDLLTSVQTEGVQIKAVALPRITGLTVTQETPDTPFEIKYDIENDENVHNLIPELQIVADGTPLLAENLTDHEIGSENVYAEFTPEQEGVYEITLRIEGTSSEGLNFADTFKVTISFSLPTPIPLPPPTTSTLIPTPTQEVVPEATTQPVQPIPPSVRPNVWSILFFVLLLVLVILIGFVAYFLFKNWSWLNTRRNGADFYSENSTPSEKMDKTIPESLDEIGDSTSFTVKRRLEGLITKRLDNVQDDADGAVRDVTDTLAKLEKAYEGEYYEQYVRRMLDQLRGVEVQVFLRAVSSGLIKQWKEDRNVDRVVSIIYDKILGLSSNPHVTFVEVAKALESEAGEPILKEFLSNWVKFYRSPDQDNYKSMSDLDVGYLDSVKQVYRFLHAANNNRFSYGNGSEYTQLQEAFLPQEGVYKSQNLYLLLKDLNPVFIQPPPKEIEAWQEYKSVLEQAAKDLTSSDKTYAKIPETHILRNQVNRWLASTQTRIENWEEEPVAIGPGKIEFELRSSLDVYVDQEEKVRNNEWTYYIRGVLYHMSGADINHLRLLYSANNQRAILVTLDKHKENIKLASGEHIKFAIVQEPVEPTRLLFELEFQTHFTVGNTGEPKQYQERISPILSIAPSLDSYLLDQELKSPFIIGRPLTSEEFKRFALRRPTQIVTELVEYLAYSEGTELIVLEGLRQSGKTTVIDVVLEAIDPNPMDSLPKYFIVKVNLMDWWEEYIQGQGITNTDSYRHQFWRCCYHCGVEKLTKFNEEENQGLIDSGIKSQGNNGTNPFLSFRSLATDIKNKTGLLPLLIVDDADIFDKFGNQIPKLMEELNSFCQSSQGIIWTANDNRSRPWIETLQTLFTGNRQAKQKTFRTSLVDERDTEKILTTNGTLELTPLAKRAAYIFTGGWVSLVQELGNGLVNEIINPKVGVDYEQAYRLVTVQDIRSVILQYSSVNTLFVDYLRASFTSYEVLLMQVMVKEDLIDKDTSILEGIRYKSGWTGKEFLREKIQQAYRSDEIGREDVEFIEKNWQGIFYQLKEKGIIENLVFQGQLSSLVRFRVGWLYSYFRAEPYVKAVFLTGMINDDLHSNIS